MSSPTAMPVLETARLRVRPFVAGDLGEVHRIQNAAWNEDVALAERERWLTWNIAAYEGLAAVTQPPYGDRAVVLRASGELVGVVGVAPSLGPFERLPSFGGLADVDAFRPEVGLYWAIDPAHQGEGYATEAAGAVVAHLFGALSLRAIVATTEYENARSLAVMRKLRMSIERNPRSEPPWFQAVGVLFHPSIADVSAATGR